MQSIPSVGIAFRRPLGIGSLYGLGGSFSPIELWNSATNVEQYAEYIEYYIF
jgi:hypothetical protein